MSPRYSLLPNAEVDLAEQIRYIAEHNLQASLHFHAAVKRACEQLADLPYSGPSHRARNPQAFGLRVKHLPKFPNYCIYYRVTRSHGVEIIRILHTARDLPRELGGSR